MGKVKVEKVVEQLKPKSGFTPEMEEGHCKSKNMPGQVCNNSFVCPECKTCLCNEEK